MRRFVVVPAARIVDRRSHLSFGDTVRTSIALAMIVAAGTVATAIGVAPACAPRLHRVAAGETLSAIARSERIPLATLLAVQNSERVKQNPSLIRTGQFVRLPQSYELFSQWTNWPEAAEPAVRAVRFELDRLLSADGGTCVLDLLREPG
jgi:LysM repeat protein